MRYQLVIQFQATSIHDWDELVSFEETLTPRLEGSALVDGHDCGSGEFNLFIFTDDPLATFHKSQVIIHEFLPERTFKVAYRDLGSESYFCLWPPELKEFQLE